MMPYAGHRRAPLMIGALTGVVHHCERADDRKHNCAQENEQRGFRFHGALARIRGPQPLKPDYRRANERRMNDLQKPL